MVRRDPGRKQGDNIPVRELDGFEVGISGSWPTKSDVTVVQNMVYCEFRGSFLTDAKKGVFSIDANASRTAEQTPVCSRTRTGSVDSWGSRDLVR